MNFKQLVLQYFVLCFAFDLMLCRLAELSSAIVMVELPRTVKREVSWCMLFANVIVFIDKTPPHVNDKLEI